MDKSLPEKIINKLKALALCIYGFAMFPVILFQLIVIDFKSGKYNFNQKNNRYEDLKNNKKGLSLIGMLVLILVIGVIAVLIINGFATTVVVVQEVSNKDEITQMGKAYLSEISKKARDDSFYEDLANMEIPPIPLTSDYTGSGRYSVSVESEREDETSTKVTLTYRLSGSLSTDKPLIVMSIVITDPQPDR